MTTDWAEKRKHAEYQASLRAEHAAVDRAHREAAAARTEIGRISDATARDIRKLLDAEQAAADAAETEFRRAVIATEREQFGRPRTVYRGGTRGVTGPIFIWHWRTDGKRVGVDYTDAPAGYGGCVWLPSGGGLDPQQHAMGPAAQFVTDSPEHRAWLADTVTPAVTEAVTRYCSLLGKLRNDAWFADLCVRTGIAMTEARTDTHQGTYEAIQQKVTIIDVPRLIHGRVEQDGLVLVYAHRVGDSAGRWSKSLDALRNAFRAEGVDASRLRVTDADDGGIELRFDDAPSSFPTAVAPPAVEPVSSTADAAARFPKLRWPLGVDARGGAIEPSLQKFPHVLVAAATGGGKSVWLRTVIETMRVQGAGVFVCDGKRSDYVALATQPGVAMVTTEPAAHAVAIAEVHDLMDQRREEAGCAKAAGDPDPYRKYPLVLLVLDEFATMRDEWRTLAGRGKDTAVVAMLASILRVGREARIACIISSQDIYVENVPQHWQDNMPLFVSLGAPSQRTLAGGAIPDALRSDVQRIGDRITRDDPGRGIYIDRAAFKVREIQSCYGYSPGTAVPSAAPTAEVRAAWEAAEAVAARMSPLYPRLGIAAEGPEWRDSFDTILDTPTAELTDAAGNPILAAERFDPFNPEWSGAPDRGSRRRRLTHAAATATEAAQVVTSSNEATDADTEDDSYRARIAAEAARLGLIPADTKTPAPAPAAKTEPTQSQRRSQPGVPEGDF